MDADTLNPSRFPASATNALWIRQRPIAANDDDYPDAFIGYKGRPCPAPGQQTRVYRNLGKPNHYSIRMLEGPYKGKVVGHAPAVYLHDVELVVSKAGRNRVLRDKERSVHAWATGRFQCCAEAPELQYQRRDVRRITYFPFIKGHFFDRKAPDRPVTKLDSAWVTGADILSLPTGLEF